MFRDIFQRLKIQQKLLIAFLPIPLLAIIFIGSLWYWNTIKAVQKTIEEQTFILAKNVGSLIEDYFVERESEVNSVAKLNWVREFCSEINKKNSQRVVEKYSERLRKLFVNLDGGYSQITFFNLKNQPVAKVQHNPFLLPEELPVHFETRIFNELDMIGIKKSSSLSKDVIYISGVKSIRGAKAVVFGIKIFTSKPQRLVGLMTLFFPVSRISKDIIKSYNLGFAGHAMIVEKNGQLLYHSERNKINQFITAALPGVRHVKDRILRLEEGTTKYQNKNEAWIMSYSPVRKVSWSVGVAIPVEPYIRSIKTVGLMGIGLTFLVCILLLFLVNFFSKKFVRGISEVTDGARALAAGDLDRTLPVRSDDEIGELATDFNKMAKDLKRMMLEVDIHKNLAAIGKFAAGMYHDIKSPLEGLKLLISGMKKKTRDEDPIKKYVDELDFGVNNLDQLIQETMDFVRPKSLSIQSVNLNEFLKSVISDLKLKNISLDWKLSKSITNINLDPNQMKHVFLNLINNAKDAMPSGGKLILSTAIEEDFLKIKIIDTGNGIEKNDLENIFQPFFSTKKKGHGLGLSIVHQIVSNHKGTIVVESDVGMGTRVVIKLPFEV